MIKFSKIHIEISNICNLQCSFCPEVLRPKKVMSEELFTTIIPQLAPLTEQVCFHLMGDPLVHPKLSTFVEICAKYGVKIQLVTNGVLLRNPQADLLLHDSFRQVNFSLHSFKDNFGDKDPTIYLERIFAFTERAFIERPDLYINYRLWNLTSPKALDVRNGDMLRRIEERFDITVNPEINVKKQKSLRLKNRLYLHFDTEFTWPALTLSPFADKGTCYGLSTHFGILVDGTVVPCCLDKEGAISLGNLQELPLSTILASERATSMLQGFRNGVLLEELCKRCQYIERFKKPLNIRR